MPLRRVELAPSACWAGAFLVIFTSGALTAVAATAWTLPVGFALATLYPALLLAGSLGYAGRTVPGWLLPAAALVGGARGVAHALDMPAIVHGLALASEPALVLAAAAVAARAPLPGPPTVAQRLLAPFLVGMALLEAATAIAMFDGSPLPESLLIAWVAGASPLLGIQIAACTTVARQQLERTRARLEDRVREETDRYRAVSELSSDYSFGFRVLPSGDIRRDWVTDAVERVTGYNSEQLDGTGWSQLVQPFDRERVFAEGAAVLAGRQDALETAIIHKSGEERLLRVRLAWGPEARDGQRIVGAARDITEEVKAERERRRLDLHMREMQRLESLGRLAGGIAHDFSNALTVILGNTKLAMEELDKGTLERSRLGRVRSASEFAAGLTEQMLTYAGEAAVTLEPLDISRVVREIQELLHASVRGKVTLETDLPDGLPAFEGDVTQIRQVLVNLVTNAAEAICEEAGSIRVRTGARRLDGREARESYGTPGGQPGHYVLLEVADTGPGLEPVEQARVFEPFFTTKSAGRGLGLASVLGIVRAHAGLVRIQSARGRGTTFQVLLPRSHREARPVAAAPVTVGGTGRVLVVDDDDAVLEVATAFLERAGFEVTTASDAGAALGLLRAAGIPCDAVVLDLVLPDLSAEETLLRIREARPGLPLVCVSGHDAEHAARHYGVSDVTAFVRKPFGPEDLVGTVRAALRASSQGPRTGLRPPR